MPAQLLAVDIGNTNATFALMRGTQVLAHFDVASASGEDELLAALRLNKAGDVIAHNYVGRPTLGVLLLRPWLFLVRHR